MTIEHSLLSHFKILFKKSIQNQNMLLLIQFCLDFFIFNISSNLGKPQKSSILVVGPLKGGRPDHSGP